MKLVATKAFRYRTRNLVAGDEFEADYRIARTLKAIRKAQDAPTAAPAPKPEPEPDPLAVARAEYTEAVGKKPGPLWDEDAIRAKMAKFFESDDSGD